jgi:hypothetical protein
MSKNNKGDLIQMDNIVHRRAKQNHHSYTNNRFMAATVSAGLLQAKAS